MTKIVEVGWIGTSYIANCNIANLVCWFADHSKPADKISDVTACPSETCLTVFVAVISHVTLKDVDGQTGIHEWHLKKKATTTKKKKCLAFRWAFILLTLIRIVYRLFDALKITLLSVTNVKAAAKWITIKQGLLFYHRLKNRHLLTAFQKASKCTLVKEYARLEKSMAGENKLVILCNSSEYVLFSGKNIQLS